MGRKSLLNEQPHLVGRRLFANLGARADWFWSEFSWDPGFKGEERFLDPAFQAEHSFHCPCEAVASADANGFGVLEICAGQAAATRDHLKVRVSASLPLQVARFVAAELSGPAEYVL